jgi:hypothetical protein
MSMIWPWLLATSILSSALTLLFARWYYLRHLKPALDVELLQLQEAFEQRVKRGVRAAGEELLPAFREHVALGFEDALKKSVTAGLVEDTAKVVTRGAGLLEEGLGLFGLKPRK